MARPGQVTKAGASLRFGAAATISEAVRRILATPGFTAEQIAELAGVGYRALMSYAYPPDNPAETHRGLPARLIVPLTLATGNYAIFDAINAQVGRVAFALPEPDPTVVDQVEATVLAVRQFGELLTAQATALGDGRVTAQERKNIREKAYQAMRAIVTLLAATGLGLEGGRE